MQLESGKSVPKEVARTETAHFTSSSCIAFTPLVLQTFQPGRDSLLFRVMFWDTQHAQFSLLGESPKYTLLQMLSVRRSTASVGEGSLMISCDPHEPRVASGTLQLSCSAAVTPSSCSNIDPCLTVRTAYVPDIIAESEVIHQTFVAIFSAFGIDLGQWGGDLNTVFVLTVNNAKTKKRIGVGTITLRDLLCCNTGSNELEVPLYDVHSLKFEGKLAVTPNRTNFTLPLLTSYETNTTFGNGRASTNFAHTRCPSPPPSACSKPVAVPGASFSRVRSNSTPVRLEPLHRQTSLTSITTATCPLTPTAAKPRSFSISSGRTPPPLVLPPPTATTSPTLNQLQQQQQQLLTQLEQLRTQHAGIPRPATPPPSPRVLVHVLQAASTPTMHVSPPHTATVASTPPPLGTAGTPGTPNSVRMPMSSREAQLAQLQQMLENLQQQLLLVQEQLQHVQ
eukprot:TRINITY_DN2821_c0_g1_i10.p1 TRINITY_DN2821_c0_g1~~TRINITY_DN2821_c0_g1_i10.p1  ORF type:complete len:451 (-),score=84.07 TRINITY_DN2821_c0_g1_i10:637-1989(-)